ncbi:hypothetical protein Ancab_018532 [Ancistrocladus abbreviatus]
MSLYLSDRDLDRSVQPTRLFGRQRPLHSIFGGGKVADILLWRNKSISGSILAGFTVIWFLFEIAEFHFITLISYILMTLMLILFIWNYAADFINRRPPSIHDIRFSEATFRYIFDRVNWSILKLYKISSGEELGHFVVAVASLWILSVIGSFSSALNLLYISFLCLATIPVLYERYEREVDYLATQGNRDMRRLYKELDSKVLSKIPRGPVKDKKFN